MVDSLGAITLWGFSPAIDLQEKDVIRGTQGLKLSESPKDTLQILLLGCGDIRHLLTTIARSWRHKRKKLKFFLLEGNLEVYVRQLLLLHLTLEPPQEMGLQEKTEFFLEIFGNSLVRQQVFDYVVARSSELLRMVTDADYLAERMPGVDLSALKFKERDQMEAILKFWRNPDLRIADMPKFWDDRLRKHLEVRYDSRKGAYDWDYSMKLEDRGKGVMNNREYAYWRETGISFALREAEYSVQNRTMVSGFVVRKGGERVAQRGYWGDIVCSPYLSFGLESEEKSFFKKANGVYTKTCQEVSVYNILSLLHELTHRERYVMPTPKPAEDKKKEESKLVEITEEEEEEEEKQGEEEEKQEEEEEKQEEEEEKQEEEEEEEQKEGKADMVAEQTPELMPLEDVEIHFLPIGAAPDLKKKSKYQKAFDIVYFSNCMVHHLTNEISPVFADRAVVMCETARYMLELKQDQCQEFATKVTAMAKGVGCQTTKPVDGFKESLMTFSFERKQDL